jgi:tetratricopeptide (TPR) repeat protein
MKRNFIFSIIIIGSSLCNGFAQSVADCPANLSIFAEYAKVKNYDAAYTPWMEVRTLCPELNSATFAYGERILVHKIKNSEDKTSYSNDLIKLYDEWLTYFPTDRKGKSQQGKILASKAQAMLDYNLAPKTEIYKIFDTAFNSDPESFTNPKGLYSYFKTLYENYKAGDPSVTMAVLFSKYEDVSEKFAYENTKLSKILDVIIKKEDAGQPLTSRDKRNKRMSEINSRANTTFANNLDAIIAQESSCENLIPLYKSNLDANRGDEKWLKRAASRMDAKECSDDPLFVELVEALHSLKPSADSAYYLGILKDKAGDSQSALEFYEESLSLENDPYRKATIYYKIAVKFKNRGQKSQARTYANQALSNQPSMGKAYLLIASLYADSANDCGNTQFEKRAVYWLAAQTVRRAAAVDPSLKSTAQKLEASYNGRAPSKTDIFTEGKSGEEVVFNCWIRSKVKVPNL